MERLDSGRGSRKRSRVDDDCEQLPSRRSRESMTVAEYEALHAGTSGAEFTVPGHSRFLRRDSLFE